MKLESITVENYRQFEKAELTFDEGITILAGANNSGKTSLINLIKNIFVDDKLNYNMSDIPAKNMREWVEWVYPIFQKFFRDRKTEENVEKDLLNVVIPKEETDSTHLMKMTTVILNYIYNDEALKQCPYEKNSNDTMAFSPKVLIVSDVEKAISDFRKTYEDALLLYVSNRARFYDIGAGNLYDAYNKMEKYQFWKKYSAVDVMTKDEARINDKFEFFFSS